MTAWGVVTIGQGVTGSFTGLVVCRLIIGFFEAGFLPGAIYLISMCKSSPFSLYRSQLEPLTGIFTAFWDVTADVR